MTQQLNNSEVSVWNWGQQAGGKSQPLSRGVESQALCCFQLLTHNGKEAL